MYVQRARGPTFLHGVSECAASRMNPPHLGRARAFQLCDAARHQSATCSPEVFKLSSTSRR